MGTDSFGIACREHREGGAGGLETSAVSLVGRYKLLNRKHLYGYT